MNSLFFRILPDVEHVDEADDEDDDDEEEEEDDDDGPLTGYIDDGPPARLFESIIGWTMRRLALMNLFFIYRFFL